MIMTVEPTSNRVGGEIWVEKVASDTNLTPYDYYYNYYWNGERTMDISSVSNSLGRVSSIDLIKQK